MFAKVKRAGCRCYSQPLRKKKKGAPNLYVLKVSLVLAGNKTRKRKVFLQGCFGGFYHHHQWKLCNEALVDLVLQHCSWGGGEFLSSVMWCCLGFIMTYLRNTGPTSWKLFTPMLKAIPALQQTFNCPQRWCFPELLK